MRSGATHPPSKEPRFPWPRRIVAGTGVCALLALGVFALHEVDARTNEPRLARATTSEPATPIAATEDERRNVIGDTPSSPDEVLLESMADDDGDDSVADDDDDEVDPAEQRLSAEIRLLENRRRARDRLLASPSERLGAADRAALAARRASLSGKLALQEERVERLRQRVGSVEAGYEAQNGNE